MLKSTKFTQLLTTALLCYASAGLANDNNWQHFYIGPKIGGAFNTVHLNAQQIGLANFAGRCDKRYDYSSFFSGVQGGYNYYLPSGLILSLEGDYTNRSKKITHVACDCDTDTAVIDNFTFENRYQGSVRGRFGYTLLNQTMVPFLMAGGSFASLKLTYTNEGGDYYRYQVTKPGWLVGAGVEKKFYNNLLLRLDYVFNHYDRFAMAMPYIYGLRDDNGNASVQLYNHNVAGTLSYIF